MNIYEFSDHRSFLRNHIGNLPKNGRGEIQRIALFAGVHPSLLSQILADAKSLNLEQAQLVAEYLGLTTQEADYFLCMVQVQRAGTEKLRRYFRDKLHALKAASIEISQRVRQDRQLTNEEKAIFYSHWLYAAVWLATSIGGGQTIEQIASRFETSRERLQKFSHSCSKLSWLSHRVAGTKWVRRVCILSEVQRIFTSITRAGD